MANIDLNQSKIVEGGTVTNNNTKSGFVHVYFRDLESHLIQHISQSEAVVGCVAWLTNFRILDAMAKLKHGVKLAVQKEDFLRPDSDSKSWRTDLHKKYSALKSIHFQYFSDHIELPGLSDCMSVAGERSNNGDPVSCVGNYNRDKNPAFPRMHNKFLLFGNVVKKKYEEIKGANNPKFPENDEDSEYTAFVPHAVWTGSFNFTQNGTRCFENAVVITDPVIVKAYYDEFVQIYSLSESLDWKTDWMAPEMRLGS